MYDRISTNGGVPVSTSQVVAQHLPFLRRYARALTGSQKSGDAYVAAVLEALIEDPRPLDEDGGARVALYRAFTKVWTGQEFSRSTWRRCASTWKRPGASSPPTSPPTC